MMELVRVALRRPYTVAVSFPAASCCWARWRCHRMIVDFFPQDRHPGRVRRLELPRPVGRGDGAPRGDHQRARLLHHRQAASSASSPPASPASAWSRSTSTRAPTSAPPSPRSTPSTAPSCASCRRASRRRSSSSTTRPPCRSCNMTFFSKTLPEGRMFDHAFNFVRVKLFTIPGLQVPAPFGGRLRQISVDLNPPLMAAKGVSPNDVVNALQILEPADPDRHRAHRHDRLQRADELQPDGGGSSSTACR